VSAVPMWPASVRLIHRKDAKNAKKFLNENNKKTLCVLCGVKIRRKNRSSDYVDS
jgi:hypothetical protein